MQEKKTPTMTKGCFLLQKWLEEHNMSMNELTFEMRAHYQQVWNWVRGFRTPNRPNALKISKITKNYVPVVSWHIPLTDPDGSSRTKVAPYRPRSKTQQLTP